jgi:amino acid transporter
VHETFRTPFNAQILAGGIAAIMAAAVPLEELHHMVSIGTLFAFVVVSGSVLILRYKTPEAPHRVVWQVLVLSVGLCALCLGLVAFLDGDKSPLLDWFKWTLTLVGGVVTLIPTVKLLTSPVTNLPSTFKCPWVPLVPILAMAGNIFMMMKLNPEAWLRLVIWLGFGLVIYFFYGYQHSKLTGSRS